jgi:tRNA U34 5-methylaminomethyl-2-thiouridine-forming methyltransferase MnmC
LHSIVFVAKEANYRIVKLASGAHSVRSLFHHETFHPVIGPVAEAEALYVKQLNLRARIERHQDEFVIWDVGLGAAANPITVLRAVRDLPIRIRILSFDQTLEPLEFALSDVATLGYLHGYEEELKKLIHRHGIAFRDERADVNWTLSIGDFPTLIRTKLAEKWPKPEAILFDAYSPAKNPAMWTLPLFTRLYQLLDPKHPCAMPTYSRSTMLRVSLLLAGFYVGVGHATGEKEETTIAANSLDLITEPLGHAWLKRVRNSTSAEPLRHPEYKQAPLSAETLARLEAHPQFAR